MMSSIHLERVSSQVDQMMQMIEKLRMENASLRQKMAVQSQERARLLHKNQRATKRLKQIIKQIKEEMA